MEEVNKKGRRAKEEGQHMRKLEVKRDGRLGGGTVQIGAPGYNEERNTDAKAWARP